MNDFDLLHIRERLDDAAVQIRHGDGTNAVRNSVSALVRFFDGNRPARRTVSRVFQQLQLEWPKRGVALGFDSSLTVTFEKQSYDVATAALYLSFVSAFISRCPFSFGARRILERCCKSGLELSRFLI